MDGNFLSHNSLDFPPTLIEDDEVGVQDQREANKIARRSMYAAVAAVAVSILALGWTIYKDRTERASTTTRLGIIDSHLAKIDTTLLLLTKSSSPQVYDAVRDSLKAAATATPIDAKPQIQLAAAGVEQLKQASVSPSLTHLLPAEESLNTFLATNKTVPEAWQLSAQLVSFRTSSVTGWQPEPCYVAKFGILHEHPEIPAVFGVGIHHFYNCTLDIGNVGLFEQTQMGQLIRDQRKRDPRVSEVLILDQVRVVYHGGPILPVNAFVFTSCTFDMSLPEKIPGSREQLLLAGLLGKDYPRIEVTVPLET